MQGVDIKWASKLISRSQTRSSSILYITSKLSPLPCLLLSKLSPLPCLLLSGTGTSVYTSLKAAFRLGKRCRTGRLSKRLELHTSAGLRALSTWWKSNTQPTPWGWRVQRRERDKEGPEPRTVSLSNQYTILPLYVTWPDGICTWQRKVSGLGSQERAIYFGYWARRR